jgi:(1->4)-alpha-D-glucan 1-alpha-D-glucosylmutase
MEADRRLRTIRRATYRVQLHAGFTFDDAATIADYLARLGVSHLYLSPVLQAVRGSTHGYDVVDPTKVNDELGGAAAHSRLQQRLGQAGLGQLLDIVPNHMAVNDPDNRWWWDVLENGPSSVYAGHFDVDWNPPESKLRNVVLLAFLGDHYGRELEAGRFQVRRDGGSLVLHYFDHRAPIAPRTLDEVLAAAAKRLSEVDDRLRDEVESLGTAFGRLPASWLTDADSVAERHRDKEILRGRLAALCVERPEVAVALDAEIEALNADVDRLDGLLDRQNYRLASWRTAAEELDYRRFFDINDLAGIRVEDEQVFTDSHQLILGWLGEGVIDGVRIDHLDGLRDPAGYLQRLRERSPDAWILAEKIIEGEEQLPDDWPIAGTTGYEWLNRIGRLLAAGSGVTAIVSGYRRFTGLETSWDDLVHDCKLEVMATSLAADLTRLVNRMVQMCEGHRRYRDYTRRDLSECLAEVIANFEVYRTYGRPGDEPSPADVNMVGRATLMAGLRRPEIDGELLSFLRDVLLLKVPGEAETEIALRFQQLSGPVMAKAVEDTAFYRYVPLLSLNEVGGDPSHPVDDLARFHADADRAQSARPFALLATSTHDTKRAEDVRARLDVLTELPDEWLATVDRWHALTARHRVADLPDANTEWLLFQTLVGAWPIDTDRLLPYLEKATRESKEHTSWTSPNPLYDEAMRHFASSVMDDAAFVEEVERFVAILRRPGWSNSLTQKLVTLTAPGVPDLYQGTEMWDFSLVDPDNRRPVDYELRARCLADIEGRPVRDLWAAEDGSGAVKLAVVARALAVRAAHPEAFGDGAPGAYEPLWGSGPAAAHLIGFVRGGRVATLATRLPLLLERAGGWLDTTVELPPGRWVDVFSGAQCEGRLPLAEVLGQVPVALLVREGEA